MEKKLGPGGVEEEVETMIIEVSLGKIFVNKVKEDFLVFQRLNSQLSNHLLLIFY